MDTRVCVVCLRLAEHDLGVACRDIASVSNRVLLTVRLTARRSAFLGIRQRRRFRGRPRRQAVSLVRHADQVTELAW